MQQLATAVTIGGTYRVDGYSGVAFRAVAWPKVWEPYTDEYDEPTDDGEWAEDRDGGQVVVVMVGDDREHTVDVEDLTPLADDEFCGCCGQVGCHWS